MYIFELNEVLFTIKIPPLPSILQTISPSTKDLPDPPQVAN